MIIQTTATAAATATTTTAATAATTQIPAYRTIPMYSYGIEFDQQYLLIKRVLDIVMASIAMIALSPLLGLIALVIHLDSPGPILFRQRRVGRGGVEFDFFKFRSMFENSSEREHADNYVRFMNGATLNERDASMPYKIGNDKRITRVGRFIRKTSLDELPQLYNILRGEMSVVGPRPPIPYEVAKYAAFDKLRLAGTPGLTGIWQVYGRGRVPFPEMIEQDIAYLRSQSILFDLKLILLTVPVVVIGRGGA